MTKTLTFLSVLFLAGPISAVAAEPLLVDVEWVSAHLGDPKVVLLHVGGERDYKKGHIPGAQVISEENVAKPHDMSKGELMLELPSPEQLRAQFQSRGVTDGSHIIVYTGKDAVTQSATRIILTLDYLGMGERTSLLNGGLRAWQRAGKSMEKGPAVERPGKLTAVPTKPIIVDAEFVKTLSQRPHHKLIDARSPSFYKGYAPSFGKSGHIPGAINIPFSSITDDKQLIDRTRLATVFQNAGINAGDTVVLYCHVGQQASLVALGARLLGHPVLFYDGAFQDWATVNRGPTEK